MPARMIVVCALAALACRDRKAPGPVDGQPTSLDAATPAPAAGGIAVGVPAQGGGSTVVLLASVDADGTPRAYDGPCPPGAPLHVIGEDRPLVVSATGSEGACRLQSARAAEEPFVATWGIALAPSAHQDGSADERQRLQAVALAALGEKEMTPDQFDVESAVFRFAAAGKSWSVVEVGLRPAAGCDSAACAESACGDHRRGALFLYDAAGVAVLTDIHAPEPGRVAFVDFVAAAGQARPWIVTAVDTCDGTSYELLAGQRSKIAVQ